MKANSGEGRSRTESAASSAEKYIDVDDVNRLSADTISTIRLAVRDKRAGWRSCTARDLRLSELVGSDIKGTLILMYRRSAVMGKGSKAATLADWP
ncbi:hypothetical protein KCP77_01225 [Salmonella enterica subsp. enterica]|nr:hypothetical protein KCP77_01225 [Salmonella enterica subsp. enterica]